jgi:hypothetical protein
MRVFKYLLFGILGIIVLAVGLLVLPVVLRANTTTFANESLTLQNKLVIPPLYMFSV